MRDLEAMLRRDGFEPHVTRLGGRGVGVLLRGGSASEWKGDELVGERNEVEGQGEGEGARPVPVREGLRRGTEGLAGWAEGLGEWVYA